MISGLKGFITFKLQRADRSLLELLVSGVTYEVQVAQPFWEQATTWDDSDDQALVSLQTHHHITEATQALFGFSNRLERDLFQVLLDVQGVGPQTAIKLMAIDIPALVGAIVLDILPDLKARGFPVCQH